MPNEAVANAETKEVNRMARTPKPTDETNPAPEPGAGTIGDATSSPETSAAPADEHAEHIHTAADPDGDHKIVTHVWAAKGQVPKAAILQTAIQSVRNAIPVVYDLNAEITGAEKKTVDEQPGTEFQVTITYTPRAVEGKTDEVDIAKVIKGLDVPRSIDGSAMPCGGDRVGPQTSFPVGMRGRSSMVALMGWMSGSSPASR
ncbi:hypothetical protein [Mycobacterium asiaticum]|uniref:hypothetical protein n=1 Tax=Mycobacterium asiaticum TaxID=1790 RepID=UPI0007EFEAEF|nr:hypothetical protein [Mycobacterium asiaticum]OBJ47547.1 hypothetical protein A9W94_05250 [Mycobacterium asiaticum]